jgi:hypothetical protein
MQTSRLGPIARWNPNENRMNQQSGGIQPINGHLEFGAWNRLVRTRLLDKLPDQVRRMCRGKCEVRHLC